MMFQEFVQVFIIGLLIFFAHKFDLQKSRFSSGVGSTGVFAWLWLAACFYTIGAGALA